MRNYRVVVPTRNSSRWIGLFAEAYRALGVEPLYVCDTRSQDDTLARLKALGMDAVSVTPTENRVETMMAFLPEIVDSEWVLRLDDDEFPSAALIRWLDETLSGIDCASMAVSRRDALFVDGRLCYSRLEDYYFLSRDPSFLDPQWRLFKPKAVQFRDAIHSPGFDIGEDWRTVPPQAYFVHFDWILRSFNERCQKLRAYEQQAAGMGWGLARFYLPEAQAPEDARWTPLEDDEFLSLARAVRDLPAP